MVIGLSRSICQAFQRLISIHLVGYDQTDPYFQVKEGMGRNLYLTQSTSPDSIRRSRVLNSEGKSPSIQSTPNSESKESYGKSEQLIRT